MRLTTRLGQSLLMAFQYNRAGYHHLSDGSEEDAADDATGTVTVDGLPV